MTGTRITLRVPPQMKAQIEARLRGDGARSLNEWILEALRLRLRRRAKEEFQTGIAQAKTAQEIAAEIPGLRVGIPKKEEEPEGWD